MTHVHGHMVTPIRIYTRGELLNDGFTSAQLTHAVRTRELIRARRGLYATPDTPDAVVKAVRIGGRLACVAALATAGIWVRDSRAIHIHLAREKSRPRSPQDQFVPLTKNNRGGCELHWRPLCDPEAATDYAVGPVDAIIQAVRCQDPWFAVASLDSALRTGFLREDQLDAVFFHLPKRLRHVRELIDARCESGLETIFRLLMRERHIPTEPQVAIPGVGRVDFVVDGCIVVETDGAEYHGVNAAARDYDRDLALAALGYTVVRVNYRQVMFEQHRVFVAILAVLASHRITR